MPQPRVGDRDIVFYHSYPLELYIQLLDEMPLAAIIDNTPGEGVLALAAVVTKTPYLGVGFTSAHCEAVFERVVGLVFKAMADEGSPLYAADLAALLTKKRKSGMTPKRPKKRGKTGKTPKDADAEAEAEEDDDQDDEDDDEGDEQNDEEERPTKKKKVAGFNSRQNNFLNGCGKHHPSWELCKNGVATVWCNAPGRFAPSGNGAGTTNAFFLGESGASRCIFGRLRCRKLKVTEKKKKKKTNLGATSLSKEQLLKKVDALKKGKKDGDDDEEEEADSADES